MRKLKYLIFLLLFITTAAYAVPKEIDWDDLIPWTSVFSPGEVKFNKSLVDKEVKIPGYVLPLDTFGRGVNRDILEHDLINWFMLKQKPMGRFSLTVYVIKMKLKYRRP